MPVEEIGETGECAVKMEGLPIERRDFLSSKLDRAKGAELLPKVVERDNSDFEGKLPQEKNVAETKTARCRVCTQSSAIAQESTRVSGSSLRAPHRVS